MKKCSVILFGVSIMALAKVCVAQPFDIYSIISAQNTGVPSAQTLNLETPFRCGTVDLQEQKVISNVAYRSDDFKLTYAQEQDALPRFEVNGFSFKDTPIDEALQQLVDEAGISVYTEDEAYVELSANDVYGDLETVVNALTKASDVYYSYDAQHKQLHLSSHGSFEIKVPADRLVMMSVLDALRGAGIENVSPNWKTGILSVTLTRSEEEKIKELLTQITSDGQMLLAQSAVYTLSPIASNANWDAVVQNFGIEKVNTADNGLMGKMLSMNHYRSSQNLLNALKPYYSVQLISQGISIVPNGWKMRFEVGKCAMNGYQGNTLSLLLNPRILKDNQVTTQVTLDSHAGELSTFKTTANIDDELAVIGVPDSLTNMASELLVTIKLKLIRLIGEGK